MKKYYYTLFCLTACSYSIQTDFGDAGSFEDDASVYDADASSSSSSGRADADANADVPAQDVIAMDADAEDPSIDAATDVLDASPDAPDVFVPPDSEFVFEPYDISHILSLGQSNSTANGSNPVLTTSQPYNNLMFDTGVMTVANCDGQGCETYERPQALVPLREGDRFFNYAVETMSSALANQISFFHPEHTSLVSLSSRSGNVYSCLSKRYCGWFPQNFIRPFDEAMMQVRDAKALAQAQNKTYIVRAATSVHGESDHYGMIFPQPGTAGTLNNYKEALFEWQKDLDTEVKKITNQTQNIPLFISQISGWTDTRSSQVAIDQYRAHKESNGKVVLIAPAYFLDFKNDCLHFSNVGTQRLGEYFAKAYYSQVVRGIKYEPLRPRSLTFTDNQTVAIDFIVPMPPLVLDTQTISNPGDYGFEAYENNQRIAITNVSIVNGLVYLSFGKDLDKDNVVITYALNQPANSCIGNPRGARGNLRDSDQTPSRLGYAPLYNWAVQFSEKVQ